VISFSFNIKLHVADLKALETIKSRLNCGSIHIHNTEDAASFKVGGVNQLRSTILPIFDNFPLNGVKHLNYLAFKEALLLYLDSSLDKSEVMEKITIIKNKMKADLETDEPEMPKEHSIRITPY
jgi:hypothetical protein